MDSKVVLGSVTEMISQNTVYSLYNPQLAQLAISVYVGALFLTVVNYRWLQVLYSSFYEEGASLSSYFEFEILCNALTKKM